MKPPMENESADMVAIFKGAIRSLDEQDLSDLKDRFIAQGGNTTAIEAIDRERAARRVERALQVPSRLQRDLETDLKTSRAAVNREVTSHGRPQKSWVLVELVATCEATEAYLLSVRRAIRSTPGSVGTEKVLADNHEMLEAYRRIAAITRDALGRGPAEGPALSAAG